jgi:hypothetical protein
MRRNAAPIIAAVLLLLPLLYVGSYLALVVPIGLFVDYSNDPFAFEPELSYDRYRYGAARVAIVFWPLEQIDRRIRPEQWEMEFDLRHGRVRIPRATTRNLTSP